MFFTIICGVSWLLWRSKMSGCLSSCLQAFTVSLTHIWWICSCRQRTARCSQEDPTQRSHAVCQRPLIFPRGTGAVGMRRSWKTHTDLVFKNDCSLDEQNSMTFLMFLCVCRLAVYSASLWMILAACESARVLVLTVIAIFKECFAAWELWWRPSRSLQESLAHSRKQSNDFFWG